MDRCAKKAFRERNVCTINIRVFFHMNNSVVASVHMCVSVLCVRLCMSCVSCVYLRVCVCCVYMYFV